MFDIGGWEFLLIAVLAIVVIGPKDLPGTIRTVTGWIRRARSLASEFQSGLDDIAREADIDSVKDDIKSGLGLDDMEETGNSIRNDIEQSMESDDAFNFSDTEDYKPVDDDDDPFLKDYLDEDEDDELDDIDPKYTTARKAEEPAPALPDGDVAGEADAKPAETVKKA